VKKNAAAGAAPARVPKFNIQRALPDAVVPDRAALKRYWRAVAKDALPHIARRPLTLVRHQGGVTFFHQRRLPPVPDAVHQLHLMKREGGEGVRLWIDDLDGLLGLVDIGAVELHAWGATVDDIEHPDLLVFDLDPGAGIAAEFVRATALALREVLAGEGFAPWCKTSGGKGLHVMVPIARGWDWDEARRWAKRFAERFARHDRRYTIRAALAERRGKLFIDYVRNGRGSTTIAAFSPRARAGFPVSMPVSWREVERGVAFDGVTMDALMRGTRGFARRRAAARAPADAAR
jgi:bifunctional non-homologous end joining protein LigD